MNIPQKYLAGVAAFALLALPALASAQSYYSPSYSYGNSYGASHIPSSAMPYVNYGYQMQQQYQNYSYPSSYTYPAQYQSQSQYQTSYPNYGYSYGYSSSMPGYYSSEPQSYSYPSGTYGPFGTQLCYWSDYPTYAPCGKDPQQWVQDPYTGMWY